MHARSDKSENEFAQWLADALGSISPDGAITEQSLEKLDAVIARTTRNDRASVIARPGDFLGPFDDFPQTARRAIRSAVERSDSHGMIAEAPARFHMFVTRRFLAVHQHLKRHYDNRFANVIAKFVGVLGYGWRGIRPRIQRSLIRRRHLKLARAYGKWDLCAALYKAGVSPNGLTNCFASGIAQPWPAASLLRDSSRNISFGLIVGIDFIANDEGMWAIECNLVPGLDPLVDQALFTDNLAAFASDHRFENLSVLTSEAGGIQPSLVADYRRSAAANDLSLTLFHSSSSPRRDLPRRSTLDSISADNTLAVRLRKFSTSSDYLVADKEACLFAFRNYLDDHPGSNFLVPPTVGYGDEGGLPMTDDAPNIVFKLSDIDAGTGVFFLRTRSIEEANAQIKAAIASRGRSDLRTYLLRRFSQGTGEFQPFIRSRLTADGRLYKIRSHAVITTDSTAFLSANRVECLHAIPTVLPEGLIEDPRPYMVNFASGGVEVPVPDTETDETIRATIDVADAIRWMLLAAYNCDCDVA